MTREKSTNCFQIVGNFPQSLRCTVMVALIVASPFYAMAAAPVVDSLTSTPTVVTPGATATITVEAHDPDCASQCTIGGGCGVYIRDELTSWTIPDGSIVSQSSSGSNSPYSASILWQAPTTEGLYTILVTLYDNGGMFCGGIQSITANLDVQVSAVVSDPPVVDVLIADPARTFPGESTQLSCSASDPDGDSFSYSWASDVGMITPTTPGEATFSSSQPGVATVTCIATDSEGLQGSKFVVIPVTDAVAEDTLDQGLVTPMRLDATSWGDVYVADRKAGGMSVVNMFSGRLVYQLPMPGITSLATTWTDDLLMASGNTASVVDRLGNAFLVLDPGERLGRIADVAVDRINLRYGVLYRRSAVLVVYDAAGSVIARIGGNGDALDRFRTPQGLASSPNGNWVVADTGHGLVKVLDLAGSVVHSFGGVGSGVGEFTRLDDVATDEDGLIYTSDSFQDRVQIFDLDGTPRDVVGTYGSGLGKLMTAAGVAMAPNHDRLLAASLNGSQIQVFATSSAPLGPVPAPLAHLDSRFDGWNAQAGSLGFGAVQVGITSEVATLQLINQGDAPLGVPQVAVTGPFGQSNNCGPYLEPGGSCTFSLDFSPSAGGLITGALKLVTSDRDLDIVLTGVGALSSSLLLNPTAVDFGTLEAGNVSDPRTLVLTNTGQAVIDIFSISASGQFQVGSDCSGQLMPGAVCSLQVAFAPTDPGDQSGLVAVATSVVGSPHFARLTGVATDRPPRLSISDVRLREGDAELQTVELEVTLLPAADEPVQVRYQTVADSAGAGEDFEAGEGRLVFAPGETSQTIAVQILGDRVLEPLEEQFYVDLLSADGASMEDSRAVVTVIDDEACLGPELLIDGNMEEIASGTGDWQVLSGNWQTVSSRTAIDGDTVLAEVAGGNSELVYEVDLRAFADVLVSDDQEIAIHGWLRASDEAGAVAQIVVEYRDADDRAMLDWYDSGVVSLNQDWVQVADQRPAPSGTALVRIWVKIAGREQVTVEIDGFSLSTLRVPVLWAEGVTAYEGDFGRSSLEFPVQLSCAYYEDVVLDVSTLAGRASAWEDFEELSGLVTLPAGETQGFIAVGVVSDEVDEPHEDVTLHLELRAPVGVVPLVTDAVGWIYNDDFCAREMISWLSDPGSWPVATVVLGDMVYDLDGVLALQAAAGLDPAAALAFELAATVLNLERGSDPLILSTVDEADSFLVLQPPGSDLSRDAQRKAEELQVTLAKYNREGCGR